MKGKKAMTVQDIITKYRIDSFRIVVYLNEKIEVLYDSLESDYIPSNYLINSIVENVHLSFDQTLEIEI